METKRCCKCKNVKDVTEFNKNSHKPDGLMCECRSCSTENGINYRRSKNGVVTAIYFMQLRSSKKRNHPNPLYTKDELREWLFKQDKFHELYNNWAISGYDKYTKPSVDRIDDYKGYSFDNIQLMTWGENDAKGSLDVRNGINNKHSKAVLQYDLEGNFIKEYYSMAQAEREIGISHSAISNICQHKKYSITSGGYKWEYKN